VKVLLQKVVLKEKEATMQKEERLKNFEKSGANANAVYVLKEAIEYGLTEEELDYLENPLWVSQPQIMKWLLEGLRSGMTLEQVKIYTEIKDGKSVYNAAQMEQYVAGFQSGIAVEELKKLLLPEFNARTMGELIKNYLDVQKTKQGGEWKRERLDLIKTLEMVQGQYERLRVIEKSYQDSQKSSQEFIRYLQKELERSREKEKRLLDSLEEIKQEKQELSFLFQSQKEEKAEIESADSKDGEQTKESLEEQLLRKNTLLKNRSVTTYLQKLFHKKSEEQLVSLFGKLPEQNLEQVRLGMEHGLSVKEIMQFARMGLSAKQAEQSRLILELWKQRQEE